MKKFLYLLVVIVLMASLSSCRSGFDKTDTANIYAQIVLSNNKKINLRLYRSKAPITVDNFIELVESGHYKNTIFHRVNSYCVQGGGYIMKDGVVSQKAKLDPIKGEFTANGWEKNDIKHELGVISMARTSEYDSATSQFFLCPTAYPSWDGQYAAFGKTTDVKSNQVILELSKMETEQNGGLSDFPTEVIKIKKINLSNSQF